MRPWLPDVGFSPGRIPSCMSTRETSGSSLPSRSPFIQPQLPHQLPLLLNHIWQAAGRSSEWKALCIFSWGFQPPGTLPGDGEAGVTLWILSYFYGTIDVKIKWEDDDLLKMQALKKGPSKKKAPEEKRRQYCNSTPGTWSLLLTPPCSSPYDSVCPPVDEAVGPQLRLESLVWSPRLSRWYVVPLRPNEIGD